MLGYLFHVVFVEKFSEQEMRYKHTNLGNTGINNTIVAFEIEFLSEQEEETNSARQSTGHTKKSKLAKHSAVHIPKEY